MGQGRPVRGIQGFFVGALIVPVFVGAGITALINCRRTSKLLPAQKHCWAAGIALLVSLMGFAGAAQEHRFHYTGPKERSGAFVCGSFWQEPGQLGQRLVGWSALSGPGSQQNQQLDLVGGCNALIARDFVVRGSCSNPQRISCLQ